MTLNKLSAAYRKLQDAQEKMTSVGKKFWTSFKNRTEFDMEELNSAAKNLNSISSGEGSHTIASLAINGLLYLSGRVRDLEDENKSLRRRLERLEYNAERKSEVSAEQQPAESSAE